MSDWYFSSAAESLRDPRVKDYFLAVLASELPDETKYQRFIDFFENEEVIRREVFAAYSREVRQSTLGRSASISSIVSKVSRELKIWDPKRILSKVVESVSLALVWMRKTQNEDGGLGYKPRGDSVFWETAFSALCLAEARELKVEGFSQDGVTEMLDKAVQWLNINTDGWEFQYSDNELIPTYNVALAVICCSQLGPERFSPDFRARVSAAINRLASSHSPDGGWASRDWNPERENRLIQQSTSEVGATSFAVCALLKTAETSYRERIERAVDWIVSCQNFEGSWPNIFTRSESDIPKTCDAMQALLAVQAAGLGGGKACSASERALAWLQSQEQAIFREGKVLGWGWDFIPREIDSYTFTGLIAKQLDDPYEVAVLHEVYHRDKERETFLLRDDAGREQKKVVSRILFRIGYSLDFTSTCLTIEALVGVPEASMPLLSSSVDWLINNQYRGKRKSQKSGMWGRNTPRITLSLVKFCKRLQREAS